MFNVFTIAILVQGASVWRPQGDVCAFTANMHLHHCLHNKDLQCCSCYWLSIVALVSMVCRWMVSAHIFRKKLKLVPVIMWDNNVIKVDYSLQLTWFMQLVKISPSYTICSSLWHFLLTRQCPNSVNELKYVYMPIVTSDINCQFMCLGSIGKHSYIWPQLEWLVTINMNNVNHIVEGSLLHPVFLIHATKECF